MALLVRRHTDLGTLSGDGRTYTAAGAISDEEDLYGPLSRNAGGKFYFEVTVLDCSNGSDQGFGVGLWSANDATNTNGEGIGTNSTGRHLWFNLGTYADYYNEDSKDGPGFGPLTNVVGTVIGVEVDFDARTMRFDVDGVDVGSPPYTLDAGAYYAPMLQVYSPYPVQLRYNGGDDAFVHPPATAAQWDTPSLAAGLTVDQVAVETVFATVPDVEVTQLAIETVFKPLANVVAYHVIFEALCKAIGVQVAQVAVETVLPVSSPDDTLGAMAFQVVIEALVQPGTDHLFPTEPFDRP